MRVTKLKTGVTKLLFFSTCGLLLGLSPALKNCGAATVTGFDFTILAGDPNQCGSVDGTGTNADFLQPTGVAVDKAGNTYVADQYNNSIRKIAPNGAVTTLAGDPNNTGSSDGIGAAAAFNMPTGVAVTSSGVVYVTDTFNNTIRKITAGGAVTTLAGDSTNFGNDDGTGTNATFSGPCGIALDAAGNLYVADQGNHTIRKVTSNGVVSTFAGDPTVSGSDDGVGSAASFVSPTGIAVGATGIIYVADPGSSTIRKISSTRVVSTLAGSAWNYGNLDGTGTNATFVAPQGVAVDKLGNVYVSDNNTIRWITSSGVVTTIAGSPGSVGAGNGVGAAASFNGPSGMATDSTNLYVADTINNDIRKGAPVVITPPTLLTQLQNLNIPIGANAALSVNATGINLSYQWQQDGVDLNGETASVLNFYAATRDDAGTYAVRVFNPGGAVTNSAVVRVLVPQLISRPQITTNDTFQLSFQDEDRHSMSLAQAGSFKLQASTNLVDWVALTNSPTLTNGMLMITDTRKKLPCSFYRILSQ